MREKLSPLSRILSSPPNLRVSGGYPLLLGGSPPLHHGGSPLLHHGGPVFPHWLGSLSTLFHHPPLSPTITQHRPSTTHPPIQLQLTPIPSLISSSAFLRNNRHHNPKTLSQINTVPAVFAPTRSVMISNKLLPPPGPAIVPPRPPPKPPPTDHDMRLAEYGDAVCFWWYGLSHLLALVLLPIEGLLVLRPPPKPPWKYYRFNALLRLSIVVAASMVDLRSSLIHNHVRLRTAPILFDKSPHKVFGVFCILLCAFWHLFIETEEDYVASTSCLGPSKYLSAIEYQGNWLNPENKISRNVPFRSQKSSGLDLEKKTRDSLFVIAKDWERKLLIVWLLDWRYWFVYVPIVSKQSMRCVYNVYVVFVEMMILGCGWEMSQHICFHSTCNAAFDLL